MKESEFSYKWEKEKPVYEAWGRFVLKKITQALINNGEKLDCFLKIPPVCRVKDDKSLMDKAFYRGDKNYDDPYEQIEDKVGIRFVVLLLKDIKEICSIIQEIPCWNYDICKNFDEDKRKSPLIFTYQSIHYILRPKTELVSGDIAIPAGTPCEVQIRTLLQHAHAELTHDAIYKSKRVVKAEVHRTVAKSMALIETTDGFFSDVVHLLNHGPLEEYNIVDRINGLYYSITGIKPVPQKSSIVIWDTFENLISADLIDNIHDVLKKTDGLSEIIKERYSKNLFYQQSVILFVYWMLKKKKRRLLSDWPLSKNILELLAGDLGINIFDD